MKLYTNRLSVIALFIFIDISLHAQTFYGLTSFGGEDKIGAIIEYNAEVNSLKDPAPLSFINSYRGFLQT